MSGVYARNRKGTPFDPLDNAAKLQDALTKYIANEKYVPKKWRFLIGTRILDKVDELMDEAIEANRINVRTNPEKKNIRKEKWRHVRTICDKLDRQLARLINVCPTADAGDMSEIIKLLDKECEYLSKVH